MSGDHPAPAPADSAASPARREVLIRLSLALGALGTAIVAVPIVGFLFAPLFERQAPAWRPVGAVGGFRIGETVKVDFPDSSPLPWAGVVAQTAAWLRREGEDRFVAFAVNCTHLGCPVRWLPGADLFMCPCHGGVYYKDGTVAAGPPPKPLSQYPVRVRNGQVEIRTSPIPITT
ncbi:MAG TPA: Rieske (2Fe-2S) protein [bacterium]|nr:Rieske (2Fe-2S) protein [bacterium]